MMSCSSFVKSTLFFRGLILAILFFRPAVKLPAASLNEGEVFKEESRFSLPGALPETAAVYGGLAFVLTEDGGMACVNLEERRMAWKVKFGAAATVKPAVNPAGEVVFDTYGTVYEVSRGGEIVSRIETGRHLAAAAKSEGRIIVRTEEGRALVFDPGSNASPAELASGRKLTAGPLVLSGLIVFGGSDGRLAAYRPAGQVIWTYEASASVLDSMTAGEGILYFATADRRFHALSAGKGKLRWRVTLSGEAVYPVSIAGKRLVLSTSASIVYCLKKRSGVMNWWRVIKSRVFDRPVVDDSLIAVSADMPGISVLDPASGGLKSEIEIGDYVPGRCWVSALWYSKGRLAVLAHGDCPAGPQLIFLKNRGIGACRIAHKMSLQLVDNTVRKD